MEVKFVGHHDCRLGKWYDSGNGKEYYSTLPSYPLLEAPHQGVHDNIIAGYEVMKSHGGTKNCMEEISKYFKQAEIESNNVIKYLDNLAAEKSATL
ncbi:CZB domain-containing protein [Helicobacter sp. 14348-15]|uniref:CZB domain-containing protein n=2 Tax=Helicobacter TaxID=209 RepID=A0ABT0TTE8_9HELI|nr:CZB domain-containing protein [Helicobacter sp. CaF467b]MCI7047965.1 CZB domain-containing protein [Helicobacter sp.]MCL9819202.1 CZB domain-containing protein [Helicobacter colisuis]MCL9821359.1 CZB domain-containing protein [Helicobacter colisuis]MCL9822672.1 CZB domain-containing protein [Helicobacter colisuis]